MVTVFGDCPTFHLYLVSRVALVEEEAVDLPQHGVGHRAVQPRRAVHVQ